MGSQKRAESFMKLDHPQRLTRPAAPGLLLKRAAALGRPPYQERKPGGDPYYLHFVRQCPCLYCGMQPAGEAAHVRFASGAHHKASGMGMKPPDRWALPLCGEHHRLSDKSQHNKGERAFWEELGINPLLVATRLYKQRGDIVAMQAVIICAIAERG
jgi:hypothetical protein